jgi:hypothetical protein
MREFIERLNRRVLVVVATVVASLPGAVAWGEERALPEPVFSRQAAFAIPFRLDPPVNAAQEPREVELQMSPDRGRTWEASSSVPPNKQAFVFRAPRDGEYWFRVRTVDATGRRHPESNGAPELRVIVDTAPPVAELNVERLASGELAATWTLSDPHLSFESLTLAARAEDPTLPWQEISTEEVRHEPIDDRFLGKVAWVVERAVPVLVKLEISDRAGNRSVVQAPVVPARPQAAPMPADDVVQSPQAKFEWAPDEVTDASLGNGLADEEVPGGSLAAETIPAGEAIGPDNTQVAEVVEPPTGRKPVPGRRARANQLWTSNGTEPDTSEADDEESIPPGETEPLPDPNDSEPALTSPPRSRTAFDLSLLPSDESLRMVNSRHFELDYEVDTAGANVTKVELWGTRDGGQTWSSYGIDDDAESPVHVTVEGDGVYGFRITVDGDSGLGGLPPRSGDAPDVWLGVDLTRPFARLIAAEPRARAGAHEMVIEWEASDERLADFPISLHYSSRPTGPWEPIAVSLENLGQYIWLLDQRLPDQVYLRLEVRDDAGNVQTIESREPVSFDRLRPHGKIRNVRPAAE